MKLSIYKPKGKFKLNLKQQYLKLYQRKKNKYKLRFRNFFF
jgi:hypothetical protein